MGAGRGQSNRVAARGLRTPQDWARMGGRPGTNGPRMAKPTRSTERGPIDMCSSGPEVRCADMGGITLPYMEGGKENLRSSP